MTNRRLQEVDARLAAGVPAASILPEFMASLQAEPEFLRRLSNLFLLTGQWPRAVATAQLAASLAPHDTTLKLDLGAVLSTGGAYQAAFKCYTQTLATDPTNIRALFARAQGYHLVHRMDEAIADYATVLSQQPDILPARSFLMVARNYRDTTNSLILEQARKFGESLGAPSAWSGFVQKQPKWKIGIVSTDLREHSCAYFLAPLLERIPANVEVKLYGDSVHRDKVTRRFEALTGHYRSVVALDNDSLANLLRADGLDVVIDLTGHFARNRLPVFAKRVAPVQVSYLGYPNTTGVLDYRIGDELIDEAGDEWTERLIRLKAGMLAYEPSPESPPVSDGPLVPTFGYFGHLGKISPACAHAWGEILHRMPGSRLIIKSDGLDDLDSREWWQSKWRDWGLNTFDQDSVSLRGKTDSHAKHLATYDDVSVTLDTWPYNGTTTLCESLWMGVPFVTLRGRRHASRVGASLLHGTAFESGAVALVGDYIDQAITLARSKARIDRFELAQTKWLQHDAVAGEFWATLMNLEPT